MWLISPRKHLSVFIYSNNLSAPLLTVYLSFNFTVRVYAVLEYASQEFHASLPGDLSDQIERIQKRALRIVYPDLSYREALGDANLMSLFEQNGGCCG